MEGFGTGEEEQRGQMADPQSQAWRDLATRLHGASEQLLSVHEEEATQGDRPSRTDQGETRTIDPETLYELVGEEVVSVLKAAHVAAERIRSKAEGVAAQVKQDIAEFQARLQQLSAELDRLTEAGSGEAPVGGSTPEIEPER